MMKHSVDLPGGGSAQRQRRQGIAREERHFARFVAGTGAAARDFADEEHLVNGVEL